MTADPAPAESGGKSDPRTRPALIAGLRSAYWLEAGGLVAGGGGELSHAEAGERAREARPLVCHLPATIRRLGCNPFPAFDLLELFAFVRPAAFCTPTPGGLAGALGLEPPEGPAQAAGLLHRAAEQLLAELRARGEGREALAVAWTMASGGWPWGPAVVGALGFATGAGDAPRAGAGLRVWERLGEWSDHAPEPPPGHAPVSAAEARARLAELLGDGAEARPEQADYASAVSQAFQPRQKAGEPIAVLAEAGTGVGKTLGYIAPASLWAESNGGTVWLSTFTRNLQHQIDGELDRLYPEPATKARRVVVRKGRENYLCLLNLEEALGGLAARPRDAVALGLMARWALRSRDGDMVGGDFPGWLPELLGRNRTLGLTDRRGECVFSACAHYGKCYIEKGVRRARRARLVIANHALVMIQAVLGSEEGSLPLRYVFDEGHHLFGAADAAFAAHLSGQDGHELRRWLRGVETSRQPSRLRGLRRRIEDLAAGDASTTDLLEQVLRAARCLPAEGWGQRVAGAAPQGPAEAFLARVRQQVYARVERPQDPYSLEAEVRPLGEGVLDAGHRLDAALAELERPLTQLEAELAARLDDDSAELDSETRRRIDGICRGLARRRGTLAAWRGMLHSLGAETPEDFVDWFGVERREGRDLDVGMHRHWIDPTRPLAEILMRHAQGLVVTSATLTDGSGDSEADWAAAEARSGAAHLPAPAIRAQVASPFDYAAATRVLVVGDVRKDDRAQVAAAYRELFLAAGGGALGLFTAIARLRAVHQIIAPAIDAAGLPLYGQHIEGMDTATLIDIFRSEEDACLLGTDAVRDGIDVPGRSLRLIVFDRVPWPRPDIRHKARRRVFGGRAHDDSLARLRLKQAFGRLIRRADDRGVFVLLDPALPSRLLGAFPEAAEVQRLGLADAVSATRDFLKGY